jgi:hypothetical protein
MIVQGRTWYDGIDLLLRWAAKCMKYRVCDGRLLGCGRNCRWKTGGTEDLAVASLESRHVAWKELLNIQQDEMTRM